MCLAVSSDFYSYLQLLQLLQQLRGLGGNCVGIKTKLSVGNEFVSGL